VLKRFQRVRMDQICISVVTYTELLYGVQRSSSRRVNRQVVDDFIRHLSVYDWNREAAAHYGEVRNMLDKERKPIGAMDLMIAAHARSMAATLVTNNTRHFGRVEGLITVNWVNTKV
jgi:tRNA(fMet)-specific endonuclease VapC